MQQKVYITRRFSFEAAHLLPNYAGACSRLHGHSYKLEVTVSNERAFDREPKEDENPDAFMVLDFTTLKAIVGDCIIQKYDHTFLNDKIKMPTAEVMCVMFYRTISKELEKYRIPSSKLKLEEVKLWETENSFASYKGEQI